MNGAMPIHCAPSLPMQVSADDLAGAVCVHQSHHGVAADAAADQGLLARPRRARVVRATRAEVGRPGRHRRQIGELSLVRGHRFQTCPRALGESVERKQATEGTGHIVGLQGPVRGEQRPVVAVALSDDRRRVNGSVELLLEQRLQERELVLDDQDLIGVPGDPPRELGIEGPGNRDLDQPDAEALEVVVGQIHALQGAEQRLVRHPGGDDRKSRPTGLEPDLVEPGSAHVLGRSLQPDLELVPFGGDRRRGQEHRRSMLTRLRFGDPLEEPVKGDGRRSVGDVGDHLDPGPQPRGPGERDGVKSELEQLPNGSRGEQRHHQAAAERLAGARQRRRLALRVVADQRHGAAERSGAADVPWRIASAARSSPGFLPYQNPTTPSYRRRSSSPISCVPATAVAASSSLTPGAQTIGSCSRSRRARSNSRSNPPSGEPG